MRSDGGASGATFTGVVFTTPPARDHRDSAAVVVTRRDDRVLTKNVSVGRREDTNDNGRTIRRRRRRSVGTGTHVERGGLVGLGLTRVN